MKTFDKILELVSKIPKGKVTTYGAIAKQIGIDPRIVGWCLHGNTDPKNIPCHRVIKSNGEIAKGYAFGGLDTQKLILKKEGIEFIKSKVDLKKFGYLIT